MAKTYTITVSDAEEKVLNIIAVDPQDWMDNFVHERCRVVIEEIVNAEVNRKLAAGETVSGSKDDIVMAAQVETAVERNARMMAEIAAREAEMAAKQGAQA